MEAKAYASNIYSVPLDENDELFTVKEFLPVFFSFSLGFFFLFYKKINLILNGRDIFTFQSNYNTMSTIPRSMKYYMVISSDI